MGEGFHFSRIHFSLDIDALGFFCKNHRHIKVFRGHSGDPDAGGLDRQDFIDHGMLVDGTSPDGRLVEAVEIKDHPFFIGVQFHPEFKSRPNRAHPIFREFVRASLKHRDEVEKQ